MFISRHPCGSWSTGKHNRGGEWSDLVPGLGPGERQVFASLGGFMFQVRGVFWMEVFLERCGLALRASALWMRWFPRVLSSLSVMTSSVLQFSGVVSLGGFLALIVEHLSSFFSSHGIPALGIFQFLRR